MVKEKLAQEMNMSIDRLSTKLNTLIYRGGLSPTGDGAAGYVYLGVVPYPSWRVVAIGFAVLNSGTSTVAEKVMWGHGSGDLGSGDMDAFGTLVQDVTANKEWVLGDMFAVTKGGAHYSALTMENEGSHNWTTGSKLSKWQNGSAPLVFKKDNVASSTATLQPWIIIEVQ